LKILLRFSLLVCFALPLRALPPYRQITMPALDDLAAVFPKPPAEYSAIHWAIWGGPQTRERIIADIDQIHANGGGVYMINNSRSVRPAYLSPEYMDLVKTAVAECKRNGMKVWIEGDCGYPDGFAGGLISEQYPEYGMQGIVGDARCTVPAGQTLDIPLPPDTLGIVANQRPAPPAPVPAPQAPPAQTGIAMAFPSPMASPALTGTTPPAPPVEPAPAPQFTILPIPPNGILNYHVPRGGGQELTVQLPNAAIRYTLTAGEPFTIPVPPGTTSLTLRGGGPVGGGGGRRGGGAGGGFGRAGGGGEPRGERAGGGAVVALPPDGHLKWTAPVGAGTWELTFIRHAYRTSPTRNDNGTDLGATKDSYYSVIDYLNPAATELYLKLIYGAYEKAVGDEFGKTVLGFRADETDYTGVNPWTPRLLETFKAEKGYDFKPYIPIIFGGRMTPEALRAKADYWDVWSGMFRDNFYKHLEAWCTARNMEFMIHLNHEELMMSAGGDMIKNEGSFWRDMRYVGVPGIDNLNQIGPGIIADFPKIAASAAHVNGHPQAWAEEGGGTGQNGKFIADYQLVRGVNFMNLRGLNRPDGSAIGWYVSRAQYLLANGRPAAQVALFHPTDSMWMGDKEADDVTLKVVTELTEHQIDFDHVDSDAIASVLTLKGGEFKNRSGQVYRAVIYPTSTVIEKPVLERLRAFATGGGKVIFVGRTPSMVVDRTFLNAGGPPDLSFATLIEPTPDITDRVVAALPPPEVKLDAACPPVKYIHRKDKDGDVYFFFNESNQQQPRTATLMGTGQVSVWDPATGAIHPLDGVTSALGHEVVPLTLGPQESRFIVIKSAPGSTISKL
jgi:hypothetical protein